MGLDEKAVEAVKQCRFRPAMRNGVPVETEQSAEVMFLLHPATSWLIRRALFEVKGSKQMSEPALEGYISPPSGTCHSSGGDVRIDLRLAKNGKPEEIKIANERGERVGDAVVRTISSWSFKPARRNGKSPESTGQ